MFWALGSRTKGFRCWVPIVLVIVLIVLIILIVLIPFLSRTMHKNRGIANYLLLANNQKIDLIKKMVSLRSGVLDVGFALSSSSSLSSSRFLSRTMRKNITYEDKMIKTTNYYGIIGTMTDEEENIKTFCCCFLFSWRKCKDACVGRWGPGF